MVERKDHVWIIELDDGDQRQIYMVTDSEELALTTYKKLEQDRYSDPILTRWLLNGLMGTEKQILPKLETAPKTPT